MNNPLKYTDPSGYFFKRLKKFLKRTWRSAKNHWNDIRRGIYAVAVGVVGFIVCGPACAVAAAYGTVKGSRAYDKGLGFNDAFKFGIGNAFKAYSVMNFAKRGISVGVKAFNAPSFVAGAEIVGSEALHHYSNHIVRQEIARFAEKNGMSIEQFNVALLALSFAGNYLVGDRKTVGNNFGTTENIPGIRGYGNRGMIGLFFDTVDVVLTYQGIPSATGLTAWINGDLNTGQIGHSLGASEVATLEGLGWIQGDSTVYALPFGRAAPGGMKVFLGDGDAINGFSLGKFLNPFNSEVVDTDFMEHACGRGSTYRSYGC
jgi:hypothetical protein